jgi:hypothetical protein
MNAVLRSTQAFEIYKLLINKDSWDFEPLAKTACDAVEVFDQILRQRYPAIPSTYEPNPQNDKKNDR